MSTLFATAAFCQSRELLHISDDAQFDTIVLESTVKTGNCYIYPTNQSELLQVYSNSGMQVQKKTLNNRIVQDTYYVNLILEQEGNIGLGQTISKHVFGIPSNDINNFWTMYLTENKPYILDLNHGLGNTDINLSNLSVNRFKIRAGSADVHVSYESHIANKVKMDTFLVQVDVGYIHVSQLDLSRAETIIAEAGFGAVFLDFGETLLRGTHVFSSVGTGILVITLPEYDTPIKIEINNSWLCSLDLHSSLKRISTNTFVNEAYLNKEPDPLLFKVDVPMGEVVFR